MLQLQDVFSFLRIFLCIVLGQLSIHEMWIFKLVSQEIPFFTP